MNKKVKNRLIGISIILIVIAIVVVVTQLIPPTVSIDNINSKFDDVTIEGLRFTNVNIVGNQLTALIQNTKSTKDSMKTITVKFFDKNNNEIESVDAYIGGKIEANEMKNLDVKTDADLSNIGNITYQINRSSCVVTYRGVTSKQQIASGAGTYYYTGTYQCNGITGVLQSCVVNSVTKVNGWYNVNDTPKYYNITNLTPQCFNACTASPGKALVSSLGANCRKWGSFLPNDATGGGLPSTIECSCDD